MAEEIPGVVRPRALGMTGAVDVGAATNLAGSGWRVYEAASSGGRCCGPFGSTVYIAPMLTLPDAELDLLLAVVRECLVEVAGT